MIFGQKDIKESLKNMSIYLKNSLYYNRRNSKCKIQININKIYYLLYSII